MTTDCLFQTTEWLNVSAPNAWDAVEVQRDGKTIARLPYCKKQRKGLTLLTMPPFVHALGPSLAPLPGKYAKQLSQQKELLNELIDGLPPHDFFFQKCHYSFNNWLPFSWKGFTQTTSYTYVLPDLSDTAQVWAGFQENIRREIRKAEKKVSISTIEDMDTVYDLSFKTFSRQGAPWVYDRQDFRDFDARCAAKSNRKIFLATDSEGQHHAAVYIVWDDRSAHYIFGGSDPDLRTSGAMSLALWEAIQFASTVSQEFDFVGSMNESIERFFRGFGARQTPYFVLTRMSRRMKLLMAGREIMTTLKSKG
jgi:lipid II:glycine glycyltransferase (peptidoglycan interpeptide bridge formation enzyme)